jgi:hypothetical protein
LDDHADEPEELADETINLSEGNDAATPDVADSSTENNPVE